MSVLVETNIGNVTIDVFVDEVPVTAKNFLKLCALKYYNNVLFFNIQADFIAQTGDPTGTGKGGSSIYGLLEGEDKRFIADEIRSDLTHAKKGTVSMANFGTPNTNGSQFFITLAEDITYLDKKNTVFGEVVEGFDVVDRLNETYCDQQGRPYQDVRIRHTYVLYDPFDNWEELERKLPEKSPDRLKPEEETVDERIPAEEEIKAESENEEDLEKKEEKLKAEEEKSRAVVLEMVGDLPDADLKPPENVLFVCKLNPVTTDEDLEMIFSRFGKINNCNIVKDFKTGNSLCYAFIEFETKEQCEEAYFKMNNVLIDDRRIKVDFSQSVKKLWSNFKLNPWEKKARRELAEEHKRKQRQLEDEEKREKEKQEGNNRATEVATSGKIQQSSRVGGQSNPALRHRSHSPYRKNQERHGGYRQHHHRRRDDDYSTSNRHRSSSHRDRSRHDDDDHSRRHRHRSSKRDRTEDDGKDRRDRRSRSRDRKHRRSDKHRDSRRRSREHRRDDDNHERRRSKEKRRSSSKKKHRSSKKSRSRSGSRGSSGSSKG
eukprot:gb/GECG01007913.1/.p1 GENE.gb/GECG01007913.1/~~gb/GECG01007913.1/.p1  ORF type:complete len:544 (+),score=100.77 gb/GECG01007913.1/:1-1632(+)